MSGKITMRMVDPLDGWMCGWIFVTVKVVRLEAAVEAVEAVEVVEVVKVVRAATALHLI